ncbi:MAG TPA: PEP/pyruvate-binding domain-containing protein, partial [Thermoanaerobaculia bacterium]
MTIASALVRQTLLVDAETAARLGSAQCGGKAAALARLTAAGERVPEWVLLPADVLETHLIAAGSIDRVQHELETLASAAIDAAALMHASRRLQQIVDELPLDAAITDALAGVVATLGSGPFAVRSSAVGEDGDRFSFAGQLDTVLDVDADTDALAAAVRRCWRSAFGARALDYRRRAGSVNEAARIAVIIQRMVQGDVSGVLFTIDPVTGDTGRMRVSACAGLGEALVSGAADADEYVLRRDGAVVEMRVVGAGRLLSGDAIGALAELGRRLEQREGGPRDIEWTMRDGELWVLQARPITTAAPAIASGGDHRIVWDNSNIQESYCGVTTPLTFSFARAAYASVYEQTMRTLGVPEGTIAAHRPMLQNLLGLLHGRVYYNLNNWYRGLLLLPAFGRNKADMERMMGVEEPVDFVTDEVPGALERLRRVPRLARTFLGLQRAFMTLDRDAARFLGTFDARIATIDRASLGTRPLAELMELIAYLRSECIERWVAPIVNDFRVMMAVGRLRRFVERAAPGDVEGLMQTLLGGADVAASAGPAMLMLR